MSGLNAERIGQEIINQGVHDSRGFLTDPAYELMTDVTPIVCVDVIPVDVSVNGIRMGIITRATGPERGKPAVLGGRIQKNETIGAAISRHLEGSFGDGTYEFHEGNNEGQPFYVAQYTHAPTAEGGFDPTKHAIAPTYLIDIPEPEVARDEASDFHWVGLDEVPTVSAYNHHLAMQRAAEVLRKVHAA